MKLQLDGTVDGCLCKNKSTTPKSTKNQQSSRTQQCPIYLLPNGCNKIPSSSTGKTALGSCTWTWKFLQTCLLFSNEETCLKICTALQPMKPVLLVSKFLVLVRRTVFKSASWLGPRRGQWTIAFACWEHQYDYSYSLKMSVSLCNPFPGLP